MYSVLIVDDEEPVLESYSYMVASSDDDLVVCGTARSGNEAVATAHRERPDIVLMDIAMPGIDGLDTIKELQRELPESLYILSTAYERFDLAQRAIPLRVFSYLVKPVSRTRFLQTLRKAREHLDERETLVTMRLEEAQSGVEERRREERRLLLQITARPMDDATWSRGRALFQLSSDHGIIAIVETPTRDHYDGIVRRIAHRYRCLSTEYLGRLLLLIPDPLQLAGFEHYIQEAVRDEVGPGATIRVELSGRRRYDEFHAAFEEILSAFTGTDARHRRRWEEVTSIRRHVARSRSLDEILTRCRRYFDDEFAAEPFEVASSRMVAFFTLLLDDLAGRAGTVDVVSRIGDPAAEIPTIRSRVEWDAWAERTLSRIAAQRTMRIDEHWPVPLRYAVAHIDTHYAEPLHLSSVAETCDISTGYLSRLFAEHLGTSFNDYLNSVRIGAAEALLIVGELSIKEIAFACGYRDPNYFSRIFKKVNGVSPTSFPAGEDHGA